MGRERWFSIPKDEISLLEIRSKIERQGVRRKGTSVRFLFLFPFSLNKRSTHMWAYRFGGRINAKGDQK